MARPGHVINCRLDSQMHRVFSFGYFAKASHNVTFDLSTKQSLGELVETIAKQVLAILRTPFKQI